MIVIDEDQNPDAKSPTGPAQQGLPSPTTAPPPAYSYGATTSGGVGAPGAVAYSPPLQYPYDVPVSPRERPLRGENAQRRFFRALAVAVLVWTLLGMLLGSFADVKVVYTSFGKNSLKNALKGEARKRIKDPSCVSGASEGLHTWSLDLYAGSRYKTADPSPSGSASHEADGLRHTTLGFSLPASVDLLYFFTNASQAYGSITIDASPPSDSVAGTKTDGGDGYVDVDVVLSYFSKKALRRSQVCLFGDGGKWGLGIVTPDAEHPTRADSLHYDIRVTLPAPSSSSAKGSSPNVFGAAHPLNISKLHTDLVHFSHAIGALRERVHFGELELRTADTPINVQSLSATSARLHTVNAPITGSFSAVTALELVTANALIKADVHLHEAGSGSSETELILHTSNSPLDAQVYLSPTSDSWPVTVNATTSNSPLALALSPPAVDPAHLPTLQLTARTTHAPITVSPGLAFAGSFRVVTRGALGGIEAPVVELPGGDSLAGDTTAGGAVRESGNANDNNDDVESESTGWRRVVDVQRADEWRGVLTGSVWWEDAKGRRWDGASAGGSVHVETSLLHAVLKL
ncbi:hypothetical protein M0805_009112 [Coniferiporia weirii]|nr:hypothetical protein M0805_009112 [Coniferiporia weirii]